jgi:hypothetical protein
MTKTDRTMLNAVSSGDAFLRKGLWLEQAPIAWMASRIECAYDALLSAFFSGPVTVL